MPSRVAGGPVVYLPCQLDREPALISATLDIRYPSLLEESGVEGLARVQLIVSTAGDVDSQSVRVTGSMHRGFDAAVRATALGARFAPGLRDGRAVAALVTLDFEFALGEALRSPAEAAAAMTLARRADTTVAARVVALRRLEAILRGRVARVFPFDATWDVRRGRPVGGCGPYRIYVSPPAVAAEGLPKTLEAATAALGDSLAGDATAPEAVRAAGYCLARDL